MVFFVVCIVHAAESGYVMLEPSLVGQDAGSTIDAVSYLSAIYKYGIGVAGGLAVIIFAIGGIYYMFPGQETKGKEFMKRAVQGVLIALGAYLLLNTINFHLLDMNVSLPTAGILAMGIPPGTGGEPDGGGTNISPSLPTSLPSGCQNYVSAFKSAGADGCLLYAIASQESSCNPNATSSMGACGMMQFTPATAGHDCNWLQTHPTESIQLAAQYLTKSRSVLAQYSQFNIGSGSSQTNKTVTVGSHTYDAGNDDLIASYNAGYGTVTASGKKGAFAVSSSCASDGVIPVWQCDKNTEGYAQTRNYVRRVQAYQDQCESSGALK
jgi:hypothetical protein